MAKRTSTPTKAKKPARQKLVWILQLALVVERGVTQPMLFEFRTYTQSDVKRRVRKAIDQLSQGPNDVTVVVSNDSANRFRGNVSGELYVGTEDSEEMTPVLQVSRAYYWDKPLFTEIS